MLKLETKQTETVYRLADIYSVLPVDLDCC
jgi:hypothetical protein